MTPEQAQWFADTFDKLVANIEQAVMGKTAHDPACSDVHAVRRAPPAGGRPGHGQDVVGEIDREHGAGHAVSRIQFTPDLLPSDVTGVTIYDQRTSQFEFHDGPIFATIVLADEINRASPKTQSALLEVMEEGQRDRRRQEPRSRGAVHGHRNAEPDRAGRHVSVARGAARPISDEDIARLPRPRLDGGAARRRCDQEPLGNDPAVDHLDCGRRHGQAGK